MEIDDPQTTENELQDDINKVQQLMNQQKEDIKNETDIDQIINHMNCVLDIQNEVYDALEMLNDQNNAEIEITCHSRTITAICELSVLDGIATCSFDKSIKIILKDIKTKQFEIKIEKFNAHNGYIYDICELKEKRLISCSYYIKIWEITDDELSLKQQITDHDDKVSHVISLTNGRFASCSDDTYVKIWKSDSSYEHLKSLKQVDCVSNIYQLKQKEILVTSIYNTSIKFYKLENYEEIGSIVNHYTNSLNHGIIELPNNLIAVSSWTKDFPIIIIDPQKKFEVIKEITHEYITQSSSLCNLDEKFFVYVHDGHVLKISINDFNIETNNTQERKELEGFTDIIQFQDKLIVLNKKMNGIKIVTYEELMD